jgi:hypothetical protein
MRKLLLLVFLLGGTVYAFAGPEEFTFIEWNGGNWENGYPYYLAPTDGPNSTYYAVMCDDYAHGGMPGQQWEANITDLGSDNISLTRFNKEPSGPNALAPLQLYDEAGWILLQTQVVPTSEWQEMNYAVWNIFDPEAPCNSGCMTWLTMAEQAARDKFPDTDFNRVYIITPVDQYNPDPHSPQEFLYLGSDSGFSPAGQSGTTPEPGTFVLMGTGMLGLLGRKFLH